MAKLFYTIDEAATRLGKTQSDLQEMVESGQLEEFKMHDQVHFKRAVIDQLVVEDIGDLILPVDNDLAMGNSRIQNTPPLELLPNDSSGSAVIDELKFDDDPTAPKSNAGKIPQPIFEDPIGLVDSADTSGIAPTPVAAPKDLEGLDLDLDLDLDLGLDLDLDSGLASGLDSKPKSPSGGIDLLGDSRGDSAAALAASDASGSMAPPLTRRAAVHNDDFLDVGAMTGSGSLSLETVGSGSGMLDESTDSDQSTVGAALLDDGGDETFGTGASIGGASGLFAEPTEMDGFDQESSSVPMATSTSGGGLVTAQIERVDSANSGLGLGLMTGSLAAIILTALVVMGSRIGGGSALAGMITQDLMMWCGGLAIATLLAGGIGFFVGKSIE